MWFNALPNDALQVTVGGCVHIYTVEEQQQLRRVLAQRGMVSRDDVKDAWHMNRNERGK